MKALITTAAIILTTVFASAQKLDRTLSLDTKFNYELYGNAGKKSSTMELMSTDKKTRTSVYVSKAGEILWKNGSSYAVIQTVAKRIMYIYVYKFGIKYDEKMRPIVDGDPFTLTDVIPVDQPLSMTTKLASELFNGKVYGDKAVSNFREFYCVLTKRARDAQQRQWEKEENEEGRED